MRNVALCPRASLHKRTACSIIILTRLQWLLNNADSGYSLYLKSVRDEHKRTRGRERIMETAQFPLSKVSNCLDGEKKC